MFSIGIHIVFPEHSPNITELNSATFFYHLKQAGGLLSYFNRTSQKQETEKWEIFRRAVFFASNFLEKEIRFFLLLSSSKKCVNLFVTN